MRLRKKKRMSADAGILMKDKKGELIFEPIIIFLFITILLLNSMNFYQMIMIYQHVNHMSKSVAQTIELEGQVSADAYDQMEALNDNFKRDAKLEITDVRYFNNFDKTIQFRDPFTVTVSDVYELEIFNPAFSPPLVIKIPISSTITGMSEVYWK